MFDVDFTFHNALSKHLGFVIGRSILKNAFMSVVSQADVPAVPFALAILLAHGLELVDVRIGGWCERHTLVISHIS